MADSFVISQFLREALLAIVLAMVLGWLGASRLRARHATPRVMFMPWSVFAMGLVCFALFSAIVVVQLAIPNKTVTVWTAGTFVVLAALSLPVISAWFFEKHSYDEDGVSIRTFIGHRKKLRWAELKAVGHSDGMKWFRLEGQDGTTGRISYMLAGLPEFSQELLRRVPPQAIDPATLKLLEDTAAGRPPRVG
jgi:hypothetical protein